jgi:predicted transcriptional regulator
MRKPTKAAPVKTTKAPFNVRLSSDEKTALEAAGAAEDRPAAYVARRAIVEWLKEKGFLK